MIGTIATLKDPISSLEYLFNGSELTISIRDSISDDTFNLKGEEMEQELLVAKDLAGLLDEIEAMKYGDDSRPCAAGLYNLMFQIMKTKFSKMACIYIFASRGNSDFHLYRIRTDMNSLRKFLTELGQLADING